MTFLPEAFISRLKTQFPQDYNAILEAYEDPIPVSIRYNPVKIQSPELPHRVPWTQYGSYMDRRPEFSMDPVFHAGGYYSQEASSMVIEAIFNQLPDLQKPIKALDLCAAPGGKSTHLLSLLDPESVLVSNEVVSKRFSILKENLTKWGYPNFIVTQHQPYQLEKLGEMFDFILVDAPCSGEGLFRKQREWADEWSQTNCELCASRQTKILDSAIKLLIPGGTLLYSTCTLNPAENMAQVDYLIQMAGLSGLRFAQLKDIGFTELKSGGYGYQALPHRVKGEPFFIAGLQKNSDSVSESPKGIPRVFRSFNGKNDHFSIDGDVYSHDNFIYQLNARQLNVAEYFYAKNIRFQLVPLARALNNKIIPEHFSAMNTSLDSIGDHAHISLEEAIAYLSHNTLDLKLSDRGWYVLKFRGINLGWIKWDGRRVINKYPMKWRLRKVN